MARETPRSNGTSSSISEHFVEIVFRCLSAENTQKSCKAAHLAIPSIRIRFGQHAFQRLHRQPATLLDRHLEVSRCRHPLSIDIPEPQSNLRLDFLLVCDFRVVDECTSLGVGRKVAGGGVFQTLDDGLYCQLVRFHMAES